MTADHCSREISDIHQEDSRHLHHPIPAGFTGTPGNASLVLVAVQKERNIRGVVSQMVRAMENCTIQATSLNPPAIRMAPSERET